MYSKLPQRPYVCHYGKLRCGKPVFPDVRFGCGGKESPGGPWNSLGPRRPNPTCLHPPPVYTSLDHLFPLLTGSPLLFLKSAGV